MKVGNTYNDDSLYNELLEEIISTSKTHISLHSHPQKIQISFGKVVTNNHLTIFDKKISLKKSNQLIKKIEQLMTSPNDIRIIKNKQTRHLYNYENWTCIIYSIPEKDQVIFRNIILSIIHFQTDNPHEFFDIEMTHMTYNSISQVKLPNTKTYDSIVKQNLVIFNIENFMDIEFISESDTSSINPLQTHSINISFSPSLAYSITTQKLFVQLFSLIMSCHH